MSSNDPVGTLGGVVDGTTQTVDGVVDGAAETVSGVVDGATDAVDDLLGGSAVSDLVDEPVEDLAGPARRAPRAPSLEPPGPKRPNTCGVLEPD